ncbi:Dihydrofolate synthase/folylpolyglutamate synthase [Vibrio stylophorae]|uniref:Dihydrofolate synthase/folylpolyglutamate synthase n=1 Tax=Vibrio stylophorae TaxID=659351 RepID=A0ABN8DSH8_9VIBR|nr:bifunctional tetrahydrofolate synthase/dihydrofolate synthase [Vibrio stylophorae]CAH0534061.1 Dihydrofolate synthase/folylpolyglutamate synthase [Vibrio stylophorae]
MSTAVFPSATSSLATWLTYLESIHTSAIDLGLERVAKVAQDAQLTKPAPTIITVAGTNGKGSTCALMEAILLQAGYRVGVYSSPHLSRYNERVRINGQELEDSWHCRAFDAIEQARDTTSLSLFEFGTLAALWLFREQQVDVVLLEVGLGGRLDATNVVDHDVCVITSLAVDHVDWLGDDIEQIGFEKAGIFRTDKPAICGQPEPPASVAAHADEIGAKLHQVGYQFRYQVNEDSWDWFCGAFDLTHLPKPGLPIANAATALMALGCAELELTDEHIEQGLKTVQLAGRMERIALGKGQPQVILDVAHNPHSAQYLATQLKLCRPQGRVLAVVGMLHDKDIAGTLAVMQDSVDAWYCADLSGPRAAKADELCQHLPTAMSFHNPVTAWHVACADAMPEDQIIVFGSFHTVGEVRDEILTQIEEQHG